MDWHAIPLHWLLVEARPDDALRLERHLQSCGYTLVCEPVDSLASLEEALQRRQWDLITSDWDHPEIGALAVLAFLAQQQVDTPLIVVASVQDEAAAAIALRAGVRDFISKTDLTRLASLIERELRAGEDRCARHSAEVALRQRLDVVIAGSQAGFWDWNVRTGTTEYAPTWPRLLGYSAEENPTNRDNWSDIVHPDDRSRLGEYVSRYLANPASPYEVEFRLRHRDGSYRWVLSRALAIVGPAGQVERLMGLHIDITDRKRIDAHKAALLEVARDISGTLDSGELLARVQRRVREVLPCDFVVSFTWDAARGAFRSQAHDGVPPERVAEVERLEVALEEGARRDLRGRTWVINDLGAQTVLPVDLLNSFGITALVATPLRVRDRPFDHAMVAYSTNPGARFDDQQVALLEAIGQQVAVALEAAELYRAQQEEAAVSGSLARFGQTILSALDTPHLLDRLSQLTTEIIGCDTSHIVLWQQHDDTFAAVAGYGYAPETWDTLRALRVPRDLLSDLLALLIRHGAAQGQTRTSTAPLWRALGQQLGVASTLVTPLYYGIDIIGFHIACYRQRDEPFSAPQQRIARGVATMTALALQQVRLVDELGQANRLKSEFIASMSHELRTPLNVLIGYTHLLASDEYGPLTEKQRQTLLRMEDSAHKLADLINATLDLSRLQAGHDPLELTTLSVAELLGQLENETRNAAQQAKLQFTWQVSAEVPELRTDAVKLKVILKNLINNATKFTSRGQITIAAQSRHGGVEVSVSDTGIGIMPDILPTIFEPFRQGDGSMTRAYEGVGLGLYVVRRLLDVLSGTIVVESEVGRGSTFTVWIPDAAASQRNRPAALSERL